MGLIARLFGGPAGVTALGRAASDMAEVFVPNATAKMRAAQAAYAAAMGQYGAEFRHVRPGLFDRIVNGLNRMPRPMLAFGTMGLFVYAMVDPEGFGRRMVGLNLVPEPLWWLLAAIVGFYFGAREAHYFRLRPDASGPDDAAAGADMALPRPPAPPRRNPALEEMQRGRDR